MIWRIFSKKGFVLIGILGFVLILIMLLIPLISWSVNEYRWTTHSFRSLQALNLADAGAEAAIWEIVYNDEQFTSWSGTNPKTMTISSFKDEDNNTIGDIQISVNQTSTSHYTVTSTGFVPNAANPVASKRVKVFVLPKTLFNNAAFGNSSVSLAGITLVDSYNSSLGPYSALLAGDKGDIGTNNILTMTGNASVKGDALVAPGGSASGVEPRITGELFYAGSPTVLDPVILPDYLSSAPISPDLSLTSSAAATLPIGNYHYQNISITSGGVLTLSAGTNIYVSQQISVTGGSSRIICGSDVKLYIRGTANFAGQGITNSTGIPGDLQIYGLGSGTTISYSGGSNFYGTIYAPECSISTSGNSSIFGAIVGNTVTLTGTGALHYDESLSQNGPSQGFTIIYWQED